MQQGRAEAAVRHYVLSAGDRANLSTSIPLLLQDAAEDTLGARATLLADIWRARKVVCDWQSYDSDRLQLLALLLDTNGQEARLPLSLLPFDSLLVPMDPLVRRKIAEKYSKQFVDKLPASLVNSKSRQQANTGRPTGLQPRPLAMAYVSYDFNNHPTAHLMEGLFVFHGTSDSLTRFNVSVFMYGKNDGSHYRTTIEYLSNTR